VERAVVVVVVRTCLGILASCVGGWVVGFGLEVEGLEGGVSFLFGCEYT
jgi:hypothetical protein